MVMIGKMSYSLYLWHWPIFSMVDYKLYQASSWERIGWKIGLTAILTALCYFYIESPGRIFFNQSTRRRLSFGLLACAVLVLVPLGAYIRHAKPAP